MADEFLIVDPSPGQSDLYGVAHSGSQILNASTGALMDRSAANWAAGKHALSDADTPNHYVASFNAAATPGVEYRRIYYRQLGASPSPDDESLKEDPPLIYLSSGGAGTLGAAVWQYPDRTLTGPAQVVNPVQNERRTIIRGDSYVNADGTALVFTKANGAAWPTDLLTGGYTVKLTAKPTSDTLRRYPAAPTMIVTGGAVLTLASVRAGDIAGGVTADNANTGTLQPGAASYEFDVQVSKAGPVSHTLLVGTLNVIGDLSA